MKRYHGSMRSGSVVGELCKAYPLIPVDTRYTPSVGTESAVVLDFERPWNIVWNAAKPIAPNMQRSMKQTSTSSYHYPLSTR